MMRRFEDQVGKALIVALFTWTAIGQGIRLVAIARSATGTLDWLLSIFAGTFSLVFVLLIVFFTIARLPARDSASGIEPRITAIAGTFMIMLLVVVPGQPSGLGTSLISTGLIVFGTLASSYCLFWLGPSFSIMATARGLVTRGPYAVVRHPLYLAEEITVIGVILGKGSFVALLIGVAQLLLQLRRIQNEERVLRRSFDAYDDYTGQVPMLIPRFAGPKLWSRRST